MFYFGTVLGLGVMTTMTSPLVYELPFLSAAVKLPTALAIGTGFGIGRSKPIAVGLLTGGVVAPSEVAARFSSATRTDKMSAITSAWVVILILVLITS